MKFEKNDLRVRMTKKMLRQGLTELLIMKPIHAITLTELCKKVDINRSTFYAHYTDIYDLLEKIKDEIFDEFQLAINQVNFTEDYSGEQIPGIMYTIFEFLKRNSDMCIIMLGENSDRRFVAKLFDSAKEKSIEEYTKVYKNVTRAQLLIFYTFMASGCIGLLELWLNGGMKESAEEMAKTTNQLILHGIQYLKIEQK